MCNILHFLSCSFNIDNNWLLAYWNSNGVTFMWTWRQLLWQRLAKSKLCALTAARLYSLPPCNIPTTQYITGNINSQIQTSGQVWQRIYIVPRVGLYEGEIAFVADLYEGVSGRLYWRPTWQSLDTCLQSVHSAASLLLIKLLAWRFNEPLSKPSHAPVSSATSRKEGRFEKTNKIPERPTCFLSSAGEVYILASSKSTAIQSHNGKLYKLVDPKRCVELRIHRVAYCIQWSLCNSLSVFPFSLLACEICDVTAEQC